MPADNWRRNLAALWASQMLTMVAFSFVFPFIPLYVQSLGVPDPVEAAQWAGIIAAAAAITLTIAQPFWGNIADRYGRKPMLLRSMVGGSITITLMGLATSPEQLLLLRLIQGGVTGTVSASNALAASSTPKRHLGFSLGLMQVAIFVGMSVGPLIGGVLSDTFGFRAAFFSAGALMLVGLGIVVAFVHEDFTPPPAGTNPPGVWAESKALLAVAAFPIIMSVIFLIQFGGTIVAPLLSLFIAELAGGTNAATYAGIIMASTGASSAFAALVFGRISDRAGHSRILLVCLIGSALTYVPQAYVNDVWQLLFLRTLLGVFLGGLMPSANALLVTLAPSRHRGAAFGLAAAANALAQAVAPISGAAIAAQLGMRSVFLITGALFLFAFGWVALGLRRYAVKEITSATRKS